MENYLTYEKYQELGGLLPEAPFNLLEMKSRKQLDLYTYNRLMDGIPENIKEDIEMIMFTLVNDNQQVQSSSGLSSETIDGYARSFKDTKESSKSKENEIVSLLSGLKKNGVPLTYRGGVNDNKQIYYPIS